MTRDKEERIRRAFTEKDFHDIKARDSWHLFKIMGEFVNGFEKMSEMGPCVSIFGSGIRNLLNDRAPRLKLPADVFARQFDCLRPVSL